MIIKYNLPVVSSSLVDPFPDFTDCLKGVVVDDYLDPCAM